ncbi:MAG TPA: hypothetical protein VN495_01455 [Candidatus Paceibacterota bacterium]|nr:hypothetical protein [Candidatus Paceibacterota bacterium]
MAVEEFGKEASVALLLKSAEAFNGILMGRADVDYTSIGKLARIVDAVLGRDEAVFAREHMMGAPGDRDAIIMGLQRAFGLNEQASAQCMFRHGRLLASRLLRYKRKPAPTLVAHDHELLPKMAAFCDHAYHAVLQISGVVRLFPQPQVEAQQEAA